MGPSMDPGRRDALGRTIMNTLAWGLMIVGGVTTFFTFGLPAIRVLRAQFWTATPCTIESSGYREGTMSTARHSEYVPVIAFTYTVAGQSYQLGQADVELGVCECGNLSVQCGHRLGIVVAIELEEEIYVQLGQLSSDKVEVGSTRLIPRCLRRERT